MESLDNYYVSSTLWGHNNDHNSGESWNGIAPIWDVMTNFDPQTGNWADPVHDHPWTIYEFYHGWRELGYDDNYLFTDIFEAHCIPGFIPADVDNSGDPFDIGDIVFLVDYMFNGGIPPKNPSSADIDANAIIDITDLVRVVMYFQGEGYAPFVGCIDYYDGSGPDPGDPLNWHNQWHPSQGGCECSWNSSKQLTEEATAAVAD